MVKLPPGRDTTAMTTPAPLSVPLRWPHAKAALVAALPGWIVARVLVGIALGLSRFLVDHGHVDDPLARITSSQGLLAWDGSFYADIAQHGYGSLPRAALRFFPLTPLLGRGAGWLGFGPRIGVVIVANLAALIAGALLWTLVQREGFSSATAKRAAWLLPLFPSAFVLVLGYAESIFLAVAIGAFVAIRDRRWLVAAALGVLAGASRPGGFILAVPIAVEGARAVRTVGVRELFARATAVLAPFVGTALFLLWVGNRFGDALLPFRVQTRSNLKGSFTNPASSIARAVRGLVHGHIGTGLHVPWMILAVILIVICFRKLPASYGWFAFVTIASAVTSNNLDSFERYALGAFPLVIVGAILARNLRVERALLLLSGAAMTGYATLAFVHAYVP